MTTLKAIQSEIQSRWKREARDDVFAAALYALAGYQAAHGAAHQAAVLCAIGAVLFGLRALLLRSARG